jgi:hypothetical protein
LAKGLGDAGFPEAETLVAEDEPTSLRAALEHARDEDLIAILAHTEREELATALAELGARPARLEP